MSGNNGSEVNGFLEVKLVTTSDKITVIQATSRKLQISNYQCLVGIVSIRCDLYLTFVTSCY